MRMKVVAVAVVVSLLLVADVQSSTLPPSGHPGLDLTGKMFTLTKYDGGVLFYPGSYPSPWASTSPPVTSRYTPPSTAHDTASTSPSPTSRHTPSTSFPTATPIGGLSVCVRYLADPSSYFTIFRIDPYGRRVNLNQQSSEMYQLEISSYSLNMAPKFRFWPIYEENMWTSVCLVMNGMNNVVQIFKDSRMSVRTLSPYRLVFPAEPLVEFPGFTGQMTDLQVWDYPLSYKEVFNYMRRGAFGPVSGSLISWSYISYSNRRNSLLEDTYNVLAQQPLREGGGRGRGRGRGSGGHLRKIPLKRFSVGEGQQTKGRQIY